MPALPTDHRGADMADAAPDQHPIYFPAPRQELAERLREGDRILDAAMANTVKMIPVGHVLVRGDGEPQTVIYRLIAGKLARVRLIEGGRRQIICMFSPGDLVAVK